MMENRRHYRVPFRTKFVFGTSEKVFTGNSVDISSGGIFVSCLDFLPRDTVCKVLFQLDPKLPPVAMGGVVKRISQSTSDPEQIPGIAFQFVPINDTFEEVQESIHVFMEDMRRHFEVAATLLGSAEPDLASLTQFLKQMHLPHYQDLGELKLHVERVLRSIELVEETLAKEAKL